MNLSAPSIFTNSWKPLLVILAVGVLYARVLAKLGMDCWADENYSHALLVPFVIGFIIWSEFGMLKKAADRPAFLLGGLTVVFAMIMLLGGTLGAELFTQRVSFALMLAGRGPVFFRHQAYAASRGAVRFIALIDTRSRRSFLTRSRSRCRYGHRRRRFGGSGCSRSRPCGREM